MGAYREGFDVGYQEGYAAGKAKAYWEIRLRLLHRGHSSSCGCQPCLIVSESRGLRAVREPYPMEEMED